MEEKIVMYDSPEAAIFKTGLSGWVSRNGQYWGQDEHMARWCGSTHRTCETCGAVYENRSYCSPCHQKKRQEQFLALPEEDWDGTGPVCLWDDDKYFWDEDSLVEYMYELLEECGENEEPSLGVVKCEPQHLHTVDYDTWCDELPDEGDGELPEEVAVKVEELNKAIRESGPVSWWAGKIRVNLEPFWKKLREELEEERRDGYRD